MSEKMSLDQLMNGGALNTPVVEQAQEVVKPQEEPKVEEVREEKVEMSSTDEARDLHAQTPHSSLDNLAALVKQAEEEAAQAEKALEEAKRTEEIKELINNKTSNYNDTIINIDEDEEEEVVEAKPLDTTKDEEDEDILAEAEELRNLKIIKFKKDDKYKSKYDQIIAKRKAEAEKRASQVVLINSGYAGRFEELKTSEVLNMEAVFSDADEFTATEYQYKLMHKHLADTSVGKMDYETFLKSTSLLELNTIYYALYSSTYPDVNEYPGTCTHPECRARFTFKYHNKDLMHLDDKDKEEVAKQISELLTSTEPEKNLANANTAFTFRKRLSNGSIIDFRHPTLYNHLMDTLKEMKETKISEDDGFTAIMPFIDSILVYVEEEDAYFELEDFESKLNELKYISDEDFKAIFKIANKIQSEYKIKYAFKNLKCPVCKKELPDQYIDVMSGMLFIQQKLRMGIHE